MHLDEIFPVGSAKRAGDLRATQERRIADYGVEAGAGRWVEDLGEDQRPVQRVPVEGAVGLVGGQPVFRLLFGLFDRALGGGLVGGLGGG